MKHYGCRAVPLSAERVGGEADVVYLRDVRHPEGAWLRRYDAAISPDDRGFVFGDGIYEVIRAYSGRLFMVEAHLRRLRSSLAKVRIEAPEPLLAEADLHLLLGQNGLRHGDALVYVQLTRGIAPRAHAFPRPSVQPTIYMAAAPAPKYETEQQRGVSLKTVSDFRWSRCDIKSVALQANVLALQHARDRGCDECLFLRDGMATEGSHTNFFGVRGGVVYTHPATNHILAGITRAVVLDMCRKAGIECREEAVAEIELLSLDEAFLTATSYEIAPVVAIDGHPVGTGVPGPITQRLQALWQEAIALPGA